MSDQGEEMSGRGRESDPARTLAGFAGWRVVATLFSWAAFFGLVSFLSDTAQIFSVIDTQPQSMVAIALFALLIASVPVFLYKVRKTRRNIAVFVVVLVGLLASVIVAWPESRKLSEWATEVNGICVEEFERARSSIDDMSAAAYDLVAASTPFVSRPDESIEVVFAARVTRLFRGSMSTKSTRLVSSASTRR